MSSNEPEFNSLDEEAVEWQRRATVWREDAEDKANQLAITRNERDEARALAIRYYTKHQSLIASIGDLLPSVNLLRRLLTLGSDLYGAYGLYTGFGAAPLERDLADEISAAVELADSVVDKESKAQ